MSNEETDRRCPFCGEQDGSCSACSDRGKLAFDENGKIIPTFFSLIKVRHDHPSAGGPTTVKQDAEFYRLAAAETLIDAYLNGATIGD